MTDFRLSIPGANLQESILRNICPGLARGIMALFLLLSVSGCQNPGQTGPGGGAAGEDSTPAVAAEILPEEDLEPEVILRSAAQILPEELLTSPYHAVRDEVIGRGFIDYYVIESQYGEFLAAGDQEVRERVREIHAIAELRDFSRTEVITDSAADAAKRSYVAAKEVLVNPWETVKATPAGLEKLFKRSKRQATDAYGNVVEWYQDDDEDGQVATSGDATVENEVSMMEKIRQAADLGIDEGQKFLKSSIGFNREFRRLAQRLGVDPYTRNAALRSEMVSMAWTATAGSFAANLVLPSVPAPVGFLADTQNLVWNSKPIDLLLRNEETILRMGIDRGEIDAFFNNDNFTLSEQTRLVEAIKRLRGAANTDQLLLKAARVRSREEARFYVRSAELLALYHEKRTPLEQLIKDEYAPVAARDKKGRMIVALPLDYVNWSQTAHDIAMGMHGNLKQHARSDDLEVWVEGSVSQRAVRELSRLGWTVNELALDVLAIE